MLEGAICIRLQNSGAETLTAEPARTAGIIAWSTMNGSQIIADCIQSSGN